ncbi:hypothetical protein AOLI_G00066320 [Acnodon oligacanthus]
MERRRKKGKAVVKQPGLPVSPRLQTRPRAAAALPDLQFEGMTGARQRLVCSVEDSLYPWQLSLMACERERFRQLPIMEHGGIDPAGLGLNCLGKPFPFLWHETWVSGGKGICVLCRRSVCGAVRSSGLELRSYSPLPAPPNHLFLTPHPQDFG